MKPFQFQHASMWLLQQLWFLLMVSMPWIIALDDTEGDRTFNLKIGFDLTPGFQGASALRIRNFQDDDTVPYKLRQKYSHRSLRAASADSSERDSNEKDKKEAPSVGVEMKAGDDSSFSDDISEDSDGDRRQKSTKGLRADEFEPKGGSALREAIDEGSESENSN